MYTRMPLTQAMKVASIGLLVGGCSSGGFAGLLSFFEGGSGSGSQDSGGVHSATSIDNVGGSDGQGGSGSGSSVVPVVVNPEPGTLILFGGGLAAMALKQRRRTNSRRSAKRAA